MLSSESSYLDAVERMAPRVREAAARIENERRVPRKLVDEAAAAGLFRLCVPAAYGGGEADPATMVAVIEAMARADGSAGWVLMIGMTTGAVAGYLNEADAREIYSDPATITGGVFAPRGFADVDGGDYVASGRWPFASGSEHCDWLMGGCLIRENGELRSGPNGVPENRMVLFPASEAAIHDTWSVSGLRGTGSHDIEISELRVPQARSVSLADDLPTADGALYKFPIFGLLALGISAVALGIAERAIEELCEMAGTKVATGQIRRLAERAAVQSDVAQSRAEVDSARAFVREAIEQARAEASAGEVSVEGRARVRLAATHAVRSSKTAVDRMYEAGGGTAIYDGSALQRCLRDVHVVTQHIMVAPPTWELTGRTLLGVKVDRSML